MSTLSFYATFVWAMLVFRDCDLTFRQLMVAVMWAISSLTRWLYCEEGYTMWLSRRYMLLRLFVKVDVYVLRGLVCSIAKSNA